MGLPNVGWQCSRSLLRPERHMRGTSGVASPRKCGGIRKLCMAVRKRIAERDRVRKGGTRMGLRPHCQLGRHGWREFASGAGRSALGFASEPSSPGVGDVPGDENSGDGVAHHLGDD